MAFNFSSLCHSHTTYEYNESDEQNKQIAWAAIHSFGGRICIYTYIRHCANGKLKVVFCAANVFI